MTSELSEDAAEKDKASAAPDLPPPEAPSHDSLKYSLLGPSLTKAGQDSVDQQKV
jgi:DNA polymerase kappa